MAATAQTKSKLPNYTSLLLVTALGLLAAKLMWLVITPESKVIDYTAEGVNVNSKPKPKINYGKKIADQHLFGVVEIKKTAVATKAPKPAAPIAAPPPKLNLKLHGIVAYKGSKRGYALISSSGGEQKVYGKGDEIEKGVIVSRIFSDKVVLNNHGQSEDIMLPKNQESTSSMPSNPAAAYNAAPNRAPSSLPPGVNPGGMAGGAPDPDTGGMPSDNISSELTKLREDLQSNPSKIMGVLRASPARENGKIVGFRVHPGSRRKLFRELGLRPNDVVLEVNGIVLNDFSKGAALMGELSQASQLSIRLKRNGQETTIDRSF